MQLKLCLLCCWLCVCMQIATDPTFKPMKKSIDRNDIHKNHTRTQNAYLVLNMIWRRKPSTNHIHNEKNYRLQICSSDINCESIAEPILKPVWDYVIRIRSSKLTIRTPLNLYQDRFFFSLNAVGVPKLSLKKKTNHLLDSFVKIVFSSISKLRHVNLHTLD